MAFLKKEVPLEGVRKIMVTNEAICKGRVQLIHRLLDHVRNLSLSKKQWPTKKTFKQRRNMVRFTF